MKTTEKISLGGFAFVVESDAYEALESYLSEIRECFRNDNSADEIVEDIEVRIAEILKEKYNKEISDCTNEEIYYGLLEMVKKLSEEKGRNYTKKKLYTTK